MVHNLNMGRNGTASMFYVGDEPWHKLGKKLDKVATSAEAIEAAQLDWMVEKRQIYFPIKNADGQEVHLGQVDDAFAVTRTDLNIPLGIVGGRYEPLQNRDAFKFFDAVVGAQEAMYHTAGALGRGEKVWILAKLPGYIRVKGEDITEKYLLLSNSHDGRTSVNIMYTPIRVVCQNTLNVAVSAGTKKSKIRHSASLLTKVTDVRKTLGIINAQFGLFEELSQRMANVELNKKDFENFLVKSGVVPKEAEERMTTKAMEILNSVTNLFEHGKGNDMPGVKGTLWAAFNGVAEYADHVWRPRVRPDRMADARANSVLFGTAQQMKQRAWDEATQMVVELKK